MMPRRLFVSRRAGFALIRAVPARLTSAFTLIELMTVIAIIAVLAAIAFPVFATVRENARRSACMTNMMKIQSSVKQFEQDNRFYPDFLFGPVQRDQSNNVISMQVAGAPGNFERLNGLYPEYVRSLDTYHCPNNEVDTTNSTTELTGDLPRLEFNGTNQTVQHRFYKYDSYDASPLIDPNGKLTNTFAVRYSRVWTNILKKQEIKDLFPVGGQDTPVQLAQYSRQLHMRVPPDETYITMCPYHVGSGKAVVLWLSGQTRVVDVAKLDSFKDAYNNPIRVMSNVGGIDTDYAMYKFPPTR